MQQYRAAARRSQAQKAAQLALRHQRAWCVAQQAAQILRTDFGVARVVVFGSVCFRHLFHPHSDVDLAVWGLEESLYYQAVGRLQGLDPDIAVDVIEVEQAPHALQEVIQQTGVPLYERRWGSIGESLAYRDH